MSRDRSSALCDRSAKPASSTNGDLVGIGVGSLSAISRRRWSRCSSSSRARVRRTPRRPCRSLLLGRRATRPRMRREVHLTEVVFRHQGVDLRGRNARVAEQLLHHPDVGPAFQEVGGERMAQGVRRDSPVDPGRLCVPREHPGAALPGEPSAALVEEERASGGRRREGRRVRAQVRTHGLTPEPAERAPPAPCRPSPGRARSPPPGRRRRRPARRARRSAVPRRTAPPGSPGREVPPTVATSGASTRRAISSTDSGCGSERGSFGWTTSRSDRARRLAFAQQEPMERSNRRQRPRDGRALVRAFPSPRSRPRGRRRTSGRRVAHLLADRVTIALPAGTPRTGRGRAGTPPSGVRRQAALDRQVVEVSVRPTTARASRHRRGTRPLIRRPVDERAERGRVEAVGLGDARGS